MVCPFCRMENTAEAIRCARCGLAFSVLDDGETFAGGGTSAKSEPVSNPPSTASAVMTPQPGASSSFGAGFSSPNYGYGPVQLTPGSDFGPRYRIESKLGEGGMGTVYKAFDRDLDRMVALKLLRPEMVADATALQRFKQELLLASKISQKNVLRIHDLGDLNGMKFISMAFVEGEDLRNLLNREGKLPFDRILTIAKQLCGALEAAQAEGVVHRDLKPHNVMVDKAGTVYVTDFGLAKSLEAGAIGMTRTNEFLGTPRYMSPEQVEGKTIDHRTDLYSLGLILYEMVAGDVPFTGDSTLQVMYKRVKEPPPDPKKLRPEMPEYLGRIILKCLEKDPNRRYQGARELLDDLDAARKPTGSRSLRISFPMVEDRQWKWVAGAVGLLLILMVAISPVRRFLFGRGGSPETNGSHQAVSVLVADFQNHTGDPIFDGTLEPMFNLALEGASFISAFKRKDARELAGQLPNPTDKLDEQSARLVAVSKGVSAVITGEISRRGDNYSVSATALDSVTGNVLAKGEVTAANKDEVLLGIPKLAAPIRTALGDSTSESVQLEASVGAFTAASLEVVHQYTIAVEQQAAGKLEESLQSFSKAVELDPNFARAYAGMASVAGNLDRRQDAEKYAKMAMAHVDRMTERERYRIRGIYYLRSDNWPKCVEEYSELLKLYPVDDIGHTNLAFCSVNLHDMAKAMEATRLALALDPKDVIARHDFALYACYSGDFQTCEREGREVRKLNPSLEHGFLVLAHAQLGQGQLPQAAETYQQLQSSGARGASLAAPGLANLALYEGRYQQAVQILERDVAADVAAKEPERVPDKLVMLAYTQLLRGDKRSALAAAEKALAGSPSAKIRFLAARVFLEAGEIPKARKLAAALDSALGAKPQAYAKSILGQAALKKHDPRQAIQLLTEAKSLDDLWLVHFDLGLAYLEAGAFTEADSEFDRCLKRRGEVLELFDDNIPTYSYLPVVYYYQGLVREGLKSPGFSESYRTYLDIRGKAGEDPLLPEIRRRLGQ